MKKIQSLTLAAALLPAVAQAQGTWNGTTNNDWGTATNWDPADIPANGEDIVIADSTGSSNQLVLDISLGIGNLQFGNTGTRNAAFSLRTTSARTLDLADGLTATGAFTGVGLTMNGNFYITADQEWNIGGEIGGERADRGIFIREIVEANGTTPAGAAAIGSLVLETNLTKTGSGQLVLAATSVSGIGNFIVNEGALKFNAGVNRLLMVGGSGNVTLNNGSQLFLTRNSGTMSITRDITLNDTAGMIWGGGGGQNATVTVDSDIAWNGTHDLNLPTGVNPYISTGAWTGEGIVNRSGTATLTLSGDLSGFTGTLDLQGGVTNLSGSNTFNGNLSGTTTIRKIDEGTLDFAGSSSHTGFFDINGGTVRLIGGNNRLGVETSVILHSTLAGTLDLNGFNQEIRALGGGADAGIVTNSGTGASVLTVRPTGTDDRVFEGVISGDIQLAVVGSKTAPVAGTPRVRLSNLANTFTGGILVDGATLLALADGTLGAVPAEFDAANITLQNNGTLLNQNFVAMSIHANRGITLGTGGGALVAAFNNNVTVNSVISGETGNGLTIVGNNGTVVFTGNNTYAGTTTLAEGTSRLRIGDGGTSGSLGTGDVINNGQLSFNRSDAYTYAGEISGTGSVTQLGGGTTTLAGNSSYTGATLVSAGTLWVTGELGATAVSVTGTARIGGTGVLGGNLNFAGTAIFEIADPSNPLMVTGNVTFGSGFGIANLSGVDWDAVALDSPFTILSTTQTFSSSAITNFGLGNAVAVGTTGRMAYFQNGSLQVVVTSSSSGDPFATWAAAAGLDGTPGKEAGFNDDPDGDGIANGLEWILGGNPLDGNSGSLITTTASAEGGLTLAFTRNEDSVGIAALAVEYSATLAAPWASAAIGATSSGPDANGVTVTIDTAPTPDAVTVTIPASNAQAGRLFGRLKTTQP